MGSGVSMAGDTLSGSVYLYNTIITRSHSQPTPLRLIGKQRTGQTLHNFPPVFSLPYRPA